MTYTMSGFTTENLSIEVLIYQTLPSAFANLIYQYLISIKQFFFAHFINSTDSVTNGQVQPSLKKSGATGQLDDHAEEIEP